MGYPDSYKICNSMNQAYKQFGNSVVIDVLQLIAQQIGKAMEEKVMNEVDFRNWLAKSNKSKKFKVMLFHD